MQTCILYIVELKKENGSTQIIQSLEQLLQI